MRPLLTVLCLGLASGLSNPALAQEMPAALVDVDTVIVETMSQTQGVVGRFVARRSSIVAARVDGPIEDVPVDVGDRVSAGDVLAELDSDRLESALALAEAELAERLAGVTAAEATQALYRQDVDRLTALRGSAAFSQARFDDSVAELNRSVGELSQARAAESRAEVSRDLAALELSYARIVAPFPGVISERHVDIGEFVRTGDPILTLVNDGDLEVDVAVPSDIVGGLVPGTAVTVILDRGETMTAVVRAQVPVEDVMTRTRLVRLTPEVDGVTGTLAAGQSLVVRVPSGESRDVVSVHKDAVISSPSGRRVFVITDGVAQPRMIEIGDAIGNRFEVLSGLEPGDVVVVRGNEGLSPGMPVQMRESG